MADFQSSTHKTKWIFTPQTLAEKYRAANQRAIEILEKHGATLVKVDADGSFSYPQPQMNAKENADKHRSKPLNIEEEQYMRVFYEGKLQEVCRNFHFPHKVQATALMYFKRFYLQWSVMEHQPKNVMLTCIYAACKVEENHVSAEELGKGISQDHHIILNNEMIIYKSLDFDLVVYAPYRSMEGFLSDLEGFFQLTDDRLNMLKETAKTEVDKIMLTDAPLLFPPGQLALAALQKSNMEHRIIDFDRYLRYVPSHQDNGHTAMELYESLNSIDHWVKQYKYPTEKDLKHINRKLKSCWGVGSNDDSSRKREKKSKHKSKRSSNEMEPPFQQS